MSTSAPIRLALARILGIAAVVGCTAPSAGLASPSAGAVLSPAPPGAALPSPTTAVASASAFATVGVGSASSGPASTSAAATSSAGARPSSRPAPTADASGLVTITSADAGSTIRLAVAQRLLVMLGTELDWTVTVSDPSVLAPVPGITIVLGAQGLYVAQKAGRVIINADGDPACRKSTPPCMAPSLLVSVTAIVK